MTKIKVIGISTCGRSAINRCIKNKLDNIEYLVIDTDPSTIKTSTFAGKSFILKDATEIQTHFKESLLSFIEDTDILFLIAGLGGNTRAEILEHVSKLANEKGILTINLITTPLAKDTDYNLEKAEEDNNRLNKLLKNNCILNSDKFYINFKKYLRKGDSIKQIYEYVNEVIYRIILSFADSQDCMMRVETGNFKKVFNCDGEIWFGIGMASGENKGINATKIALGKEKLNANGVFISIRGGESLCIHDTCDAATTLNNNINDDAKIIVSTVVDESMPKDDLEVIALATGC